MYLTVLTTECPPDVLEKVLSDYAATRQHSIVYYCKLNAAVPQVLEPTPYTRRTYYLVESYDVHGEFLDACEIGGRIDAFQRAFELESDAEVKILYIKEQSGSPTTRQLLYTTGGLS